VEAARCGDRPRSRPRGNISHVRTPAWQRRFRGGDRGPHGLDVIRAVTINGAEMLGWQDRIGAIEPGKFADVIAVAGNPIADITELERVQFVMRDGQVIRNDLVSR
jgi:cytosine/adenosine deaminase-related metal-dependent hydrolase